MDSTFAGGHFFRDFINNYLSAYSESFLFWRITRKGTITPGAHKPEPSNFHALVSRRFDRLVRRDSSPDFFSEGGGTSVHRLEF